MADDNTKNTGSSDPALPEEAVFSKIYKVRDQKVMLDRDLAEMYGVETKTLKRAVRRNIDRFPEDFLFELTKDEWQNLRYQIDTSSWGGTRYLPMAFTEQGVAMLSSVLKSDKAIHVNIQIMRVFTKMRQWIGNYEELLERIEQLEANEIEQNEQIKEIYNTIKELLEPTVKERRRVGFKNQEN